jgi:hypothetical protein
MSNTITPTVFYRTLNVEGLEIFYREAGPRDGPPFCSCTVFRRKMLARSRAAHRVGTGFELVASKQRNLRGTGCVDR